MIALAAAVWAAIAFAAPKFPTLSGRVVDDAQLLSPETERRLDGELAQLEAKTGRQLVVATLPDLQGYEIEEYGYQLGRAWGIGDKDKDDGALLIVAPKERKVRIEVGYGLEPVLTDALSSVIIQRQIIPAFKAGNMEDGVVAGAEALIRQLSLPEDEAKAQAQQAKVRIAKPQGRGDFPIPAIVLIVIVFWVLTGLLRGFGRRRRYGGSGLWWLLPMILSSSSRGGGRWSGGGWGGGGGGGGFSGGGGSFGGGGSSGSW